MSPIEQRRAAETRMDAAKRQFTAAARAAIRGDLAAPELAKDAYSELNAAREHLRTLPLILKGGCR